MKKTFTLIVTIMVLLGSACEPPADDYDQIAEEVCKCMQPLSGLYSSLKSAMEENDLQALDELAEEIEEANDELDLCAENIEEKHGKLEGTRGDAVKLSMKSKCPDIIQIMNEVEQELVK
ncbi:MAG: hypothetical protein MI974_19295 [Chitinophagales bacterium]|nr:hypothetical protein [Chitinophagales bacterium]